MVHADRSHLSDWTILSSLLDLPEIKYFCSVLKNVRLQNYQSINFNENVVKEAVCAWTATVQIRLASFLIVSSVTSLVFVSLSKYHSHYPHSSKLTTNTLKCTTNLLFSQHSQSLSNFLCQLHSPLHCP